MRLVASWSRSTVAAFVLVPLAFARPTFAVVFDRRVDRFEADGNAYGPAGGPLDLVDDFDDGNLAPAWQPGIGTAVESGGFLHLTNPGQIVLINPINYEISNVESTTTLVDGLGNFTLTSWWPADLPALGHEFDMSLYDAGTVQGYTIDIQNYEGTTGLAFSELLLDFTGTPHVYSGNRYDFSAAQVTGEIALRIAFNDAADTVQASVSLDGGASFVTPFAPVWIPGLTRVVQLGAAPELSRPPTTTSTSLPSTTTTSSSSTTSTAPPAFADCTGPAASLAKASLYVGPGSVTVHPSASFRTIVPLALGAFAPSVEGIEVLVEQIDSDGFPPFVLDPFGLVGTSAVPPGLPGAGCDPRDGWRVTGSGFIYRNVSDRFPPGCEAGSARGLNVLRLVRRRGNTTLVRGKAKGPFTYSFRPGTVLHAVVLGRGSSPLAAGRCVTATLRCTNYPSVALCAGP